ncbi:MAG: hypothetical protein AB7O68_16625 [Pirellulales bacterium]
MADPPKRRWFQFRLSTWFVLVAIVAWAMVEMRHTEWEIVHRTYSGKLAPTEFWREMNKEGIQVVELEGHGNQIEVMGLRRRFGRPPQYVWPALALAGFLSWKTAWAIGPRIVRRRDARAAE